MTTSPNDPAPTPAPAPATDWQQQVALAMQRFVDAFIQEGAEVPKAAPLTDEWLVAYWTGTQMNGTRTPGECVKRAADTLVEYRKRYPKPA